jgi:hypothetical protein
MKKKEEVLLGCRLLKNTFRIANYRHLSQRRKFQLLESKLEELFSFYFSQQVLKKKRFLSKRVGN